MKMSTWRHRHTETMALMGEADTAVMQLQSKETQGLPANYQGPRRGKKEFFCRFQRDYSSTDALTSGF